MINFFKNEELMKELQEFHMKRLTPVSMEVKCASVDTCILRNNLFKGKSESEPVETPVPTIVPKLSLFQKLKNRLLS